MNFFSKVTLRTALRPYGLPKIISDVKKYYFGKKPIDIYTISPWSNRTYSIAERQAALKNAAEWLLYDQSKQDDNGFGTYHLPVGWSSSYPETSGYIIPTLNEYGQKTGTTAAILPKTILCADWLCQIQRPSGGWQSGYVKDNKPEVVFNTGQVLRGLIDTYIQTGDQKYLASAVKGAHWLCDIQDPEGYWQKHTYLNMIRVYDSYVAAPMAQLYSITNDERIKAAVEKHIDWIIDDKQLKNGWFADADNQEHLNDQPILHTIAYTTDGILDCGMYLNNEKYIAAARKTADKLFAIFNKKKYLAGRFDKDWKETVDFVCLTGCAQTCIVWLKLYNHTKDIQYFNAALKMNDFLIFTQETIDAPDVKGAIAGSFPIWGDYIKYGYPNWATKYFMDALLLEMDHYDLIKN